MRCDELAKTEIIENNLMHEMEYIREEKMTDAITRNISPALSRESHQEQSSPDERGAEKMTDDIFSIMLNRPEYD